ncbi:sensor histidine kinase [Clostridium sp. D2Q-14]|uniref:sensor histidine kinase n=1 Tax=Anaeromonas gelatinilytica TaxID=2683194 RepID=UPI00193B2F4C|nr:sensor histidine kinase [Anaeromonas gelatinilytica]MBS4535125.1 sensor histidine kinase [Anaeromonas gelatinilytica]
MAKQSIKRILIKFIVFEVFFVASIFLAFIVGTNLAIYKNLIYPASYPQTVVQEFGEKFQEGKADVKKLPDFIDYALLDKNNEIIESTIDNEEQITEILNSKDGKTSLSGFGNQQIRLVKGKNHHLILSYRVLAQFRNAWLRDILPTAELLMMVVACLIFVSGFLLIVSYYAKMINRELQLILTVKDDILREDLSETEQKQSNIKEIQEILASVYKLKDALTVSLQAEWRQKKQAEETLKDITHDIKTPVALVVGNLELLEETELTEEQANYLEFSQKGIQRVDHYINDLRIIANLEKPKTETPVSLDKQLVEEFIKFVKIQIRIKNIECVVTQRETCPDIFIHKQVFLKGFQNIIVNAVEQSPVNSKITLSFENHTDYFDLSVTDTGKGFSKESLVRGKEKFYTEATARHNAHYGMGLAIVDKIVKDHNGELILSNNMQGQEVLGAKVIIRLWKEKHGLSNF